MSIYFCHLEAEQSFVNSYQAEVAVLNLLLCSSEVEILFNVVYIMVISIDLTFIWLCLIFTKLTGIIPTHRIELQLDGVLVYPSVSGIQFGSDPLERLSFQKWLKPPGAKVSGGT